MEESTMMDELDAPHEALEPATPLLFGDNIKSWIVLWAKHGSITNLPPFKARFFRLLIVGACGQEQRLPHSNAMWLHNVIYLSLPVELTLIDQFNFKNVSRVGYTGLQSRPDSNGTSIVHAAFSSFQNGTTSTHRNYHNGADSGPGVSCAVDINGNYNHTYILVVENSNGTTWRGSLVDTVTGNSTVVGEWTLPVGAGKIVNGQVGFVEYYPWNRKGSHPCDSLPWTKAIFYDPTSKTNGTSGGAITSVYETGNCVGRAALNKTKIPGGYDLKVGFHV
ncbi:hypothetical protein MVEG_08339 [Podila verticillata NRRL 6337]|nr:hypothetical protein MVEG_08339 [Podila verticillata NRRL 6337]